MRWPESQFVGIDLAERSIDQACARAELAGVKNVTFFAEDLMGFEPEGESFDFIIAHGFFSWVPDEVKAGLFAFCHRYLAAAGIVTVSFNLEAGWKPRLPVIAKVRAIQQAVGGDEMAALAILEKLTKNDDHEFAIIGDMMAKGSAILAFDDFAPVNDPWPLDRFSLAAARAGLRWLGESDPGENIPSVLAGERVRELKSRVMSPLDFQMALDEAVGRTFRSGMLCRDDAPVAERMSLGIMLGFCVSSDLVIGDPSEAEIVRAVGSYAPFCMPVTEVIKLLPDREPQWIASRLFEGITCGHIRSRIEPLQYELEPPEFPKLNAFRLLCARHRLPLVDAWHKPCDFPTEHYRVLAAMDGSQSLMKLTVFSESLCPELAFGPWIRHLAWRGMFA